MPHESGLAWHVEAACAAAWPALCEARLGLWLLRTAPGISRRSNSLNPIGPDAGDVDATIGAAAPLFAVEGLPVLFRVLTPLLDPAVDRRLDALGFTVEGETVTLYGDLATVPPVTGSTVERLFRPDEDWLAAMAELQGYSPAAEAAYGRVVDALTAPAAFLRIAAGGETAALGFGVVHGGLMCCESIITAPAHRGRGHARRLMQALCAWAAAAGAHGVCLQVVADNAPAFALYRGLGIATELYRYHYRRAQD
jgi:GNAT superfamily N-acetyltransferase